MKEGIQDMELLPLYCSDGNFRSHKEKHPSGWKTHYDNYSINKMINISSDQVYKSHHQSMMIFENNGIRFINKSNKIIILKK